MYNGPSTRYPYGRGSEVWFPDSSFAGLVGFGSIRQFLEGNCLRQRAPSGSRGDCFIAGHKRNDRLFHQDISLRRIFVRADITPQSYLISVSANGKTWKAAEPLLVKTGETVAVDLELSDPDQSLTLIVQPASSPQSTTGNKRLTSGEVSSLPLNERDFSKLLLLAAGTMTDTNGAANFTQQFTVNGLRGTTSVFAMDGADTSDPNWGARPLPISMWTPYKRCNPLPE